ncbi:MAG: hypothetical protein ICV73_16200 [Acetobacteraceae bacterium]|nr:hypothetical protein [Acetobacteraceae bacterium]
MPTSSHDLVRGTTGNDTLDGGHGNDVMSGWLYMPQRQHAEINADTGDDLMIGGSGNDNIFAGGGADTLYGGHGRDYLVGGAGGGAIHGGTGNDYFVFAWADLGRTKLNIEPGDAIMDWHEGDRIDVSQFASRAQPRVAWEQVAPGVAEVTVVVPGLTAAATRYTTATFEVRGADVATLDRGDFILGNGDDVHAPPR